MRPHALPAALLAVILLALPAAADHQPVDPSPAFHEELGRALDEPARHLHDLGARWREHFQRDGERPLITLMLRHRAELGLSSEQVQGLEQLRADFQREAVGRAAELRAAETNLQTLLEADAADLTQVEPKLREIERLRADLRLARIRTIEQGKGLLSPEQRARLRELLQAPASLRSQKRLGLVGVRDREDDRAAPAPGDGRRVGRFDVDLRLGELLGDLGHRPGAVVQG